MKKIIAILLFTLITSCSTSDDTPRSQIEILPVDSVSMPDQFIVNQTHIIDLIYYLPSSCHIFNDIYYTIDENKRIVAIVSEEYSASNDCQEMITEAQASLHFRPRELGTYIFKFWQGESSIDNVSEDIYLDYEIEVVE